MDLHSAPGLSLSLSFSMYAERSFDLFFRGDTHRQCVCVCVGQKYSSMCNNFYVFFFCFVVFLKFFIRSGSPVRNTSIVVASDNESTNAVCVCVDEGGGEEKEITGPFWGREQLTEFVPFNLYRRRSLERSPAASSNQMEERRVIFSLIQLVLMRRCLL